MKEDSEFRAEGLRLRIYRFGNENNTYLIMEQDYMIAGFRLRMEGEPLVKAVANIGGFGVFAIDSTAEPNFRFVWSEEKAPAFTAELYRNDPVLTHNRFGRYEKGYIFETAYIGSDQTLTVWIAEGSRTAYFSGNLDVSLLRFACWIAFGVLIAPQKAVAIHTSTIVFHDKAVIFLGESGTGKSTHTRLWRENIEGATLLNDDSPIVRIHNGIPYVYGSPWSGKTPCYKTNSYELVGCVRLSQAPYNEIKKLKVMQAYAALHPSCPPDFAYDEKLYDCISQILNDILVKVPVYHLACLPNAEASHLSCKTIFGV